MKGKASKVHGPLIMMGSLMHGIHQNSSFIEKESPYPLGRSGFGWLGLSSAGHWGGGWLMQRLLSPPRRG